MKAVILFSGGLDSSTLLGVAQEKGFDELYTIGFGYGQSHDLFRIPSEKVKEQWGIKESVLLELPMFAPDCSLVNPAVEVPKHGNPKSGEVPNTWVPGRNLIFLTHAANYALSVGATDLFIGVNQLDYSGYPDCRGETLEAMEEALRQGIDPSFNVWCPLLNKSKADIIKWGTELGVDYSETMSCYDPKNESSCGACDACQLRKEAFAIVGLEDPIPYFLNTLL